MVLRLNRREKTTVIIILKFIGFQSGVELRANLFPEQGVSLEILLSGPFIADILCVGGIIQPNMPRYLNNNNPDSPPATIKIAGCTLKNTIITSAARPIAPVRGDTIDLGNIW